MGIWGAQLHSSTFSNSSFSPYLSLRRTSFRLLSSFCLPLCSYSFFCSIRLFSFYLSRSRCLSLASFIFYILPITLWKNEQNSKIKTVNICNTTNSYYPSSPFIHFGCRFFYSNNRILSHRITSRKKIIEETKWEKKTESWMVCLYPLYRYS